jgi:hypothetical protein
LSKKKKSWFYRLVLAIATAVVLILVIEALFRITLFSPIIEDHPCSPGWNHPQYMLMPDDNANYAPRPYFQGRLVNDFGDFDVPVTINSMGLRDGRLETDICGDCYRILMFGDSNTFGEGVLWEETYAALIEKRLNQQGPRKVQILNAGAPSDSLAQMFERLKKQGRAVRPDLVTVCWVPYTFGREVENRMYMNGYLVDPLKMDRLHAVGANIFYSPYPPGSRLAELDIWLQSHSFIYFFSKYRLWERIFHVFADRITGELNVPPVYLARPMETVKKIDGFCKSSGSGFLLIVLGPSDENAMDIMKYCRDNHIAAIDVARRLYADRELKHRLLFSHDAHLNPAGHASVAEEMAPRIHDIIYGKYSLH